MFKKLCKALPPLLLLAAVPAMAAEPVPLAEQPVPYNCDYSPSCEVAPGIYGAMSSPVTSKFKLSIGGYVKLDYAHNSNASGPTTNPAGASAGVHKEESIFTAKQSRFWLKVGGPTFLGAKTNALIEADFYGAGSLSNEFGNMRMRHAYGSIDWPNTQVLFGQFWDVFGPAAADTIDFRQGGDTGTPNSPRVPQIRLTQKLNLNSDNAFKFVLGLQNPVQDSAVAGSNAFPTVVANGGNGSMVNVAGQIMFSSKVLGVSPGFMGLGMSPLQVGLFGMFGNEKIPNNQSVDSYGYGLYGFVPLLKSSDGKGRAMTLSLETQAALVNGLNVQNGTSLAFVGTRPNLYAAKGFTVYGQLKFYPTQELGVTAGYMRRGAIDYSAYNNFVKAAAPPATAAAASFQKYNELSYINLTYDLNAAIRLATEYEHHVTQYGGNATGTNYGQNNVYRMSAYYFF
jgi:hypothetical protein